MAMRPRKLFPAPTETNETTDCSGFCDPACPYNCYPYEDYYFLSPPPPTPSPPLSEEHQLSPYVIVVIALLATFFLILSYYVIASKSCAGWFGSSRTNRQQQQDNAGEEFLDENRVDHPIWFITTIGLQQSIINSISICKYKKGEGLIEGTECSVCLSEFQQGETLRLLPKCNHAFHISCIDTWLRSHTNCPLCRAHIVSDAASSPFVSVSQNPVLDTNSNIRIENSENDGVMASSQERLNELHDDNANRAAEVDATLQPGEERTSKENGNSDQNGDFQVLINRVGDESFQTNIDIKPTRRSLSMDSLTAATMCLGLEIQSPAESEGTSVNPTDNIESTESAVTLKSKGRDWSSYKPAVCSSIVQCLHKNPVPMKRSYSCGGRLFSSRQNRSLNSILPL